MLDSFSALAGRGFVGALRRASRLHFIDPRIDGFKHAIEVPIDVFICESDDPVAVRAQKLSAPGVIAKLHLGRMRRAVDLNDQLFVPTNEVAK
jgi:hypothetical protein